MLIPRMVALSLAAQGLVPVRTESIRISFVGPLPDEPSSGWVQYPVAV